jgi:hypothetical protein
LPPLAREPRVTNFVSARARESTSDWCRTCASASTRSVASRRIRATSGVPSGLAAASSCSRCISVANLGILTCVRADIDSSSGEPSRHTLDRNGQNGPMGKRRRASVEHTKRTITSRASAGRVSIVLCGQCLAQPGHVRPRTTTRRTHPTRARFRNHRHSL